MKQLDELLSGVMDHKLPAERDVMEVCQRFREINEVLSNVVVGAVRATFLQQVDGDNLIIVGDLHGQFDDLLHMMGDEKLAGQTSLSPTGGKSSLTKNFLFLGDYVDRGHCSLETILFITLLKLLHPQKINILRGNHELRQICQAYGFYDEVMKRYGNAAVWKEMNDMFDYLPLAAIVHHKAGDFYCVHGGISPTLRYIDQIQAADRQLEIENDNPLADLMWSDPEESLSIPFANNPRGTGHIFSEEACQHFLERNQFKIVIRSHQLAKEGYQYFFGGKCVIVWSVPNYCYREGNKASILVLPENSMFTKEHFVTYSEVEEDPLKFPLLP